MTEPHKILGESMKKTLLSTIAILTMIQFLAFAESSDRKIETGKAFDGTTGLQNVDQEEIKKILLKKYESECEDLEGITWQSCRIIFNKIDDTSADVTVIVPAYSKRTYKLEKLTNNTGSSWQVLGINGSLGFDEQTNPNIEIVKNPSASQKVAQEEIKEFLLKREPRCKSFEGSSWDSCRIAFYKIDDTLADVNVIVPDYGETKYFLEKRKGIIGSSWKIVRKSIQRIF